MYKMQIKWMDLKALCVYHRTEVRMFGNATQGTDEICFLEKRPCSHGLCPYARVIRDAGHIDITRGDNPYQE